MPPHREFLSHARASEAVDARSEIFAHTTRMIGIAGGNEPYPEECMHYDPEQERGCFTARTTVLAKSDLPLGPIPDDLSLILDVCLKP